MKRWLPQLLAIVALLCIGWFAHSMFSGSSTESPGWSNSSQGNRSGRSMGRFQYGDIDATDNDVVPVEVTSSLLAVIRERVRGSGILEPERQVSLLSRVEGSVDMVNVEEGQSVTKGTTLCAIDQQELKISENLARIEMEQARASLDRLEGLSEIRGVTNQELEDSRFALQKSQASHARALIDLGHSQPIALFDGIIIRRRVEPGQYVRVGDELFAFADFEPLRVRLYLPESEVGDIELGQRCVLRSDSDGPVLSEGTVERISPVVDRESLTVEVLTSFPDAGVTLRPGSFAHIDIITRVLENCIIVPRKAVVTTDGRARVFRLLEDGETVQEIEIVTGFENESIVVCEEGLGLGDRVVVQGVADLQDRSRVSVYREIPVHVDSLTVERQDDGSAAIQNYSTERNQKPVRETGDHRRQGAGKPSNLPAGTSTGIRTDTPAGAAAGHGNPPTHNRGSGSSTSGG